MIHRLTKADVPESSLMLWVSDVHLGIEHRPALELMINCAEREGVTHVVAGGDIFDCHAISRHEKDIDRAHIGVKEEAYNGRWLTEWFSTRPTYFIAGNHEGRIDRFVAENPGLVGITIPEMLSLPAEWTCLPVGGELRLGNLVMEHLDGLLKKSNGGKYPAQRILDMAPDQSTIGGHVHRITMALRSTLDEYGIQVTRGAWTMGHMSREEKHYGYVSKRPNWQMGFGLIRVWWEGNRPRWHVYQIEVMLDRKGRPYFEYNGRLYRRS